MHVVIYSTFYISIYPFSVGLFFFYPEVALLSLPHAITHAHALHTGVEWTVESCPLKIIEKRCSHGTEAELLFDSIKFFSTQKLNCSFSNSKFQTYTLLMIICKFPQIAVLHVWKTCMH